MTKAEKAAFRNGLHEALAEVEKVEKGEKALRSVRDFLAEMKASGSPKTEKALRRLTR